MSARLEGESLDFTGAASQPAFKQWRDAIGRGFLRFDFEPVPAEYDTSIKTRLQAFNGVMVGWCATTPMTYHRTSDLLSDGASDLVLLLPGTSPMMLGDARSTHEIAVDGAALWDVGARSFAAMPRVGEYRALRVGRERLRLLCPDIEDRLLKPSFDANPAGRLLRTYLALVMNAGQEIDGPTSIVIGQHIVDLMLLATGAVGDVHQDARRRGWGAARFAVIKADIVEHISRHDLSLRMIMQRHKISERYLQALFENEGTTFTDFVLEQRLILAHRLLCSPSHTNRKVSDVAHSAGFGDLSYFHRTFKRRFGDTPVGVRATATRAGEVEM